MASTMASERLAISVGGIFVEAFGGAGAQDVFAGDGGGVVVVGGCGQGRGEKKGDGQSGEGERFHRSGRIHGPGFWCVTGEFGGGKSFVKEGIWASGNAGFAFFMGRGRMGALSGFWFFRADPIFL
ncbi:MAG: hypothetical protein AAF591_02370 [Verrucomicrobiota bacterium]